MDRECTHKRMTHCRRLVVINVPVFQSDEGDRFKGKKCVKQNKDISMYIFPNERLGQFSDPVFYLMINGDLKSDNIGALFTGGGQA